MTPQHDAGEEARRRRARAAGLLEEPKPGQVDARGRGSARLSAAAVSKKRGLRAAEPVEQEHVAGPSPIVSVEMRWRPTGTSWMRRSGGPAVGQAEQALEADREVEVAARVERALARTPRRRTARPRAARSQVAASVPIDDVGRAPRDARAHAGAVRGAADLPRAADVAQADVVGGVEAGVGAQVALGQRAERLIDEREPRGGAAARTRRGTLRRRRYADAGWRSVARPSRPGSRLPPMREIRLHDTRTGERAAARAARRRPGRASTPAGRPSTAASTSATRGRSSSSPCSSASSSTRATTSTLVVNITDVNDKIYDAARERGRAQRRAGARDDRRTTSPTPTGSGSAGPTTSRCAIGDDRAEIVALIEALIERGHAYAVERRRLLPRAPLPRVRRAVAPRRRPDGPGRGRRGRRPQGGPARLRAVEGAEGGRGHRLGRALGPRAGPGWHIECSAMAEELLGRRLRHPRRRHRPRLPPPRERGGADARGARRARWRGSGCTTACCELGEPRRCPSRSATSARSARRSTQLGRDALVLYFCGGHYRQPIAFSRRALDEARRAACERIRDAGAPARRRARRRSRLAPLRDALLRRARRRLQHAAGAGGAVRLGARGQPARRSRSATRDLREMLDVLGLENLLDAGGEGRRAEVGRARRASASAARARARLRARPTGCATSCARRGLGGARRPGRARARRRRA